MVAGKNTTNHLARAASAPKLPPLPKLRVRKPDQTSTNPCLGVMSTMLGMWTSQGSAKSAIQTFNVPTCRDIRLIPAQVAGHPLATPQKAAPLWNKRCEYAWIRRYENSELQDQNSWLTYCFRDPKTTARTRSTSTSPASIPKSSARRRGSKREWFFTIIAYA